MVSAPDRRELVRYLVGRKLSESRSLAIADMSASAYRYAPRPDRNVELREMTCALANRHKRYGVGMIYATLLGCETVEMFEFGAGFTRFDGNPQGFRIITRLAGIDDYGMNLLPAQIAATVKYPCDPHGVDNGNAKPQACWRLRFDAASKTTVQDRRGSSPGLAPALGSG
jgi:dGTP triphosphohydrolase